MPSCERLTGAGAALAATRAGAAEPGDLARAAYIYVSPLMEVAAVRSA